MSAPRNVRRVACALAGATGGWLLWSEWPVVFGEVQPWDSGFAPYWTLSAALTFLAALIHPANAWFAALGVLAGQVAYGYIEYLPTLPRHDPVLFPPFIAVPLLGGVPVVVGALVPYVGWWVSARLRRRREPPTDAMNDGAAAERLRTH